VENRARLWKAHAVRPAFAAPTPYSAMLSRYCPVLALPEAKNRKSVENFLIFDTEISIIFVQPEVKPHPFRDFLRACSTWNEFHFGLASQKVPRGTGGKSFSLLTNGKLYFLDSNFALP
jgi:hypothetical protein